MPCNLCPRKCRIDRGTQSGFCKAGSVPTMAKVMLHKWEEPCICTGNGSGAVFFSGCQLRCVFCQNHEISAEIRGENMDEEALARLFLSLEEQGACNLNLVSPTPHLITLLPALRLAKEKGLSLPVVYNCGGYEEVDALRKLEGLVDVYLPDFKFMDPSLSQALAGAKDYPEKASLALPEMQRQTGKPVWEGELLRSGTLVRHLILPGKTRDSIAVLHRIRDLFEKDGVVLSLLRQYTPMHKAKCIPSLSRRLTTLEYERVVQKAGELGFHFLYTQKKESASEDFVPDFLDK